MPHRYTLKRIDPWSVLKFASILSVVLFFILTLTVAFIWFILTSFDLVNRGCDVALDVGFSSCNVTADVVFRATALVAGLIAVVHAAVLMFGAFFYNLIAELAGGIGISLVDEEPAGRQSATSAGTSTATKVTQTAPKPELNPPATRPQPPITPTSGTHRDELFE